MSIERKDAHKALDRLFDACERGDNWSQATRGDLNAILGYCKPLLSHLWRMDGVDGTVEHTRNVISEVLRQLNSILPQDMLLEFGLAVDTVNGGEFDLLFAPTPPLKRKGWMSRMYLPLSMGAIILLWSETLPGRQSPHRLSQTQEKLGVDGAVEHACELLEVDRATAYRWFGALDDSLKLEIKHVAKQWMAGEDVLILITAWAKRKSFDILGMEFLIVETGDDAVRIWYKSLKKI